MTRTTVCGAMRRTSWANWCGGSMRVDGRIQRNPTGWSVPQWIGTA